MQQCMPRLRACLLVGWWLVLHLVGQSHCSLLLHLTSYAPHACVVWFFKTTLNELYPSNLTFSESAQLLSVDSPIES